jgi:DNA-binding MarR family transcriptional regulator
MSTKLFKPMIEKYVYQVRAFNRFYTVFLGILNNTYLHSKFSLVDVRVMYAAITKPGVISTEIVSMLNVDKSYLSRIILRLEKMLVIARKQSKTDRRSYNLYITAFGQKEFDKLDSTATRQMCEMLQGLNEAECKLLIKSMNQIEAILSKLKSS